MFVVIAHFDSKSEHRRRLIDALIDYGRDVQQNEPGTLRFEVIQDRRNPNRFYFYQVYQDRAGWDAHAQRPEFAQRWDTLKDWLAEPLTHLCSGANIYPPNDDASWHRQASS